MNPVEIFLVFLFGASQSKTPVNYEAQVATVITRTKDILPDRQSRTLIFGPSPRARKAGGAGQNSKWGHSKWGQTLNIEL